MKRSDLLINTNGYVLSLLEKILDANVIVKGVENIPKNNPRMFVANHFTRTEAMLVPYTMYNLTGKKVGVIADDSLFKTYFGDFLSKLGAMRKSHPLRDNHILNELLCSSKDWMIFPEGQMVKAKDIEKIDNNFCVKIDGTCQRVFTGATYFALYSQLLRQNYFNKRIKNFKKFKRKYLINDDCQINKNETMIVPINISYSKLRNKNNFLMNMAKKLLGEISNIFQEELLIESNIILNSKIIIQILEPISTKELIKSQQKQLNHNKTISNIRYEASQDFMDKIYQSVTINFDHIFILILFLYPKKSIELKHFKRLIYLCIQKIDNRDFFIDEDIKKDLIYLISYENYEQFEDVLQLAIDNEILIKKNSTLQIDKQKLLNNHTHHTIRVKNILKVILNEVLVNQKLVKLIKKYTLEKEETVNKKILKLLSNDEKNCFFKSREKYKELSKLTALDIGIHKYYDLKQSDTCIITLHGFSSAPKEVCDLSTFLYKKGFAVYAPRLDGHGTSSLDLKNKTWEDWYKSVCKAIAIASIKYSKIYLVGFSTGGLLALLSAKKKYKNFEALICINAALNLKDIRVKALLPAVSFWNDLVRAFKEEQLAKDYIENSAENPHINYDKHYVESIEQLNKLMEITRDSLKQINTPTLIIQGKDDPVVNPSSAYEIYDKINSKNKELKIVEASNHVIIKGENTQELFESIYKFIKDMNIHNSSTKT